MIVVVTMKTPDALDYACQVAAEFDGVGVEDGEDACSIITDKWMEYGEYLRVRFDTGAGTAEVISNKG